MPHLYIVTLRGVGDLLRVTIGQTIVNRGWAWLTTEPHERLAGIGGYEVE